jgi:hypothetical protein
MASLAETDVSEPENFRAFFTATNRAYCRAAIGNSKAAASYDRFLIPGMWPTNVEHPQITLGGQPVTGDIRVTNIYRRESGAWEIVHHHTDDKK